MMKLNETTSIEHLAHPINAYHLLKHITFGWNTITMEILNNKTWREKNHDAIIFYDLEEDIGRPN